MKKKRFNARVFDLLVEPPMEFENKINNDST